MRKQIKYPNAPKKPNPYDPLPPPPPPSKKITLKYKTLDRWIIKNKTKKQQQLSNLIITLYYMIITLYYID